MLATFKDVNYGFYKWLTETNTLKAVNTISFQDYNNETFNVEIKIGSTESEDLSQEHDMYYPSIIITPYSPKEREGFPYNEQPYFAALSKSSEDLEEEDIIRLFNEPIPMAFRYEIGVFSRRSDHKEKISEWLSKKFLGTNKGAGYIRLNTLISVDTVFGNDIIGDTVGMKFEHVADPFRTDGISEVLFEANLFPWIHLKDPITYKVVKELIINSSLT